MKMAVDYGRKIGFTGDFYVEPKPKEPMEDTTMYDTNFTATFYCNAKWMSVASEHL